ncbi:saccharopine dehydrogenase-like oxidoreductase [Bradysia coprophila]|uniref:saccharopine dehydrogenase-like oxidoreductase n=1 Tax=Bradysia coprophila TaxID=38358 RepID=UPI00187D73B8|nr:saccharopine dehydrogenase-like oxidoreductase [Bradysia coprophila]
MANENRLDIIVFGATGYTGGYVVESLIATIDKENPNLTWGVAGRSEKKTTEVLNEVSKHVGKSLVGVEVIVADVKDEDSILKMCKRGRIIINCVGPYSLYGEVVVKNCILAKSHHVDLAGEAFFLESMQLKYHDKAVEAGVFIVGSCGFDSIPADLGIIELQKNCTGEIAWIETFAKITAGKSGSVINHGTWDSAVQFIANLSKMKRVRRELYESFFKVSFPTFTHKCKQKYLPYTPPEIGEVTVPFWETDKFVVKRTQLENFIQHKRRPIQMSAYLVVGSWLKAFGMYMFAILFGTFAFFACGRKLLNKYPSFFSAGNVSLNGPTRKQVTEANFEMTIVGHGWKDKLKSPTEEPHSPPEQLIVGRWRGPEAAYAATSIFLMQAAITILKENNTIEYKGGVLTPGLAFEHTTLVERLRRHGVLFELINKIK